MFPLVCGFRESRNTVEHQCWSGRNTLSEVHVPHLSTFRTYDDATTWTRSTSTLNPRHPFQSITAVRQESLSGRIGVWIRVHQTHHMDDLHVTSGHMHEMATQDIRIRAMVPPSSYTAPSTSLTLPLYSIHRRELTTIGLRGTGFSTRLPEELCG